MPSKKNTPQPFEEAVPAPAAPVPFVSHVEDLARQEAMRADLKPASAAKTSSKAEATTTPQDPEPAVEITDPAEKPSRS